MNLFIKTDGLKGRHIYFQQDGATCHTSGETIELLRERFPGWVISRNGDYNWPPRSCDLTPLAFFLWGHVYADVPPAIQELKEKIRAVIDEIESQMCKNLMENFFESIPIFCFNSKSIFDIILSCFLYITSSSFYIRL